jgi:hypothetical protein
LATRAQLLDAGFSAPGIQRRVRKGLLHREYRGIYRVGHRAPSLEAAYLAAVLACGEGAALSGRAAGYVLGVVKGGAPEPEVTAPAERRPQGVSSRRVRRLDRRDVTAVRGIPATNVPRTLVDLAAVLDPGELARACHEAAVRYRTTPAHVEAVLARMPNAPGAATLRAVLSGDEPVLLSRLEGGFRALLQGDGLDLPETNIPAGGCQVDCRWPGHRLTVELDSYQFHNSRHSWEVDRRREREAYARGDAFRRYTWGDVFEHPAATLRELRPLLGR